MRGTLWSPAVWLSLFLICTALPASAGEGDEITALRGEVDTLTERLTSVENELREIKALLRRMTEPGDEPPSAVLAVEGHPSRGAPGAALTLIEFSDYECPFCGRYFRETLPQIEREYIATGRVRYVFRNFPLESIHKDAFRAAEAAKCAGEQGKYWEMHDRLFANQEALGPKDLPGHAAALRLDLPGFEQCLASARHAAAIRQDLSDAQQAGVRGTPAFFLGVTEPDGKTVKTVKTITGAYPYATFKETIDGLLAPRKE